MTFFKIKHRIYPATMFIINLVSCQILVCQNMESTGREDCHGAKFQMFCIIYNLLLEPSDIHEIILVFISL